MIVEMIEMTIPNKTLVDDSIDNYDLDATDGMDRGTAVNFKMA